MATSSFGTIFKWTSILTVIVIIAAGLIFGNRLAEFQQRVAQLKAEGMPVSFNDLKHEVTDPANDMLTYILKAKPQLEKFCSAVHEIEPWASNVAIDPEFSDESLEAIEDVFSELPDLLPTIEQAASCTDISVRNSPVVNGSINGTEADFWSAIQNTLRMSEVLLVKGRTLIARGQFPEAVECGLQAMRMARITSTRADGIVHLMWIWSVGANGMEIVHEVISNHPVDNSLRDQIDAELDSLRIFDAGRSAIRGERASVIEHLADDGIQHIAINGPGSLHYLGIAEKVARKEFFEYDVDVPEVSALFEGPFTQMLAPVWFEYYRDIQLGQISRTRALRIVNALTRKNVTGTEWESVKDQRQYLVSIGVPETMTVDTATGEVMTVEWEFDHWKVYSVGIEQESIHFSIYGYGF